jgi:hypothetical protein
MLNADHMMVVALALITRARHCLALTTRFVSPLTRLPSLKDRSWVS